MGIGSEEENGEKSSNSSRFFLTFICMQIYLEKVWIYLSVWALIAGQTKSYNFCWQPVYRQSERNIKILRERIKKDPVYCLSWIERNKMAFNYIWHLNDSINRMRKLMKFTKKKKNDFKVIICFLHIPSVKKSGRLIRSMFQLILVMVRRSYKVSYFHLDLVET